MISFNRQLVLTLLVLCMSQLVGTRAFAHLIVAQHGTLRVTDKGVYMVLSLPASAFEGLDEDRNGEVSMLEFNNHRRSIIEAVKEQVILYEDWERLELEGIMLTPDLGHDSGPEALSQVVVMGRFNADDPAGNLRFHVGLYGMKPAEQLLKITASSRIDSRKAAFELTAGDPASLVFSG